MSCAAVAFRWSSTLIQPPRAVLYCLYLAAILFSFVLPDYLGRRSMLIGGAAVCASCLTIVSGLNVGISPSTEASQKAGLAMIFIWYFTFGVSCSFFFSSSEGPL